MQGGQIEAVSRTVIVEDEIKRPADTTDYDAGDVFCDAVTRPFQFRRAARTPGAGGVIQSALLIDSVAQSTKPDLELYLFTSNLVMQADNAAWAPTDFDMESCIGWISFPLGYFKIAGANGIIQSTDKALAFACEPKSVDLFGVLVPRNAYTPTSAERIRIKLGILQD